VTDVIMLRACANTNYSANAFAVVSERIGHFGDCLCRLCTQTHNNETENLTL